MTPPRFRRALPLSLLFALSATAVRADSVIDSTAANSPALAPTPDRSVAPALERKPLRVGSFTIYSENDKYFAGTDQAYTNGFKFSWLSTDLSSFTDPSVPAPVRGLSRALGRLVPENHPYKLGFSLGQNIYTPVDTATTAYQPGDRPYAAWLYAGIAFHVHYPEALGGRASRLDVFEINAGMVGPSALGREVQNGFHDIINVDHAEGWENQIGDEFGLNLIYERKYRFSTREARTGWGADFIPHAGFSLGNVFTYANAGAELRAGWRLPADFGSNLIRPSGDSNSGNAPRARFGIFLFGAVDGRAVARDITLDGNTFKDSPDIDKEPFVADLYAGIGINTTHFQLRYAQAYRTREFKGQDDSQVFGSISLTLLF